MIASERVLRTAAMFGMTVGRENPDDERRSEEAARLAWHLDGALGPGQVALVTGPSGAGKSSVLRALVGRLGPSAVVVDGGARPARDGADSAVHRRAAVDLFDLPLDETLRVLARAGLADAPALLRPVGAQSEGQAFRVRLAVGMEEARSGALVRGTSGTVGIPASLRARFRSEGVRTLIVDEFASTLDRTTAACVAWTFARWVRATPGVRAVVATAHEDVRGGRGADVLVTMRMGA